jgi:hypothetical protein
MGFVRASLAPGQKILIKEAVPKLQFLKQAQRGRLSGFAGYKIFIAINIYTFLSMEYSKLLKNPTGKLFS